MLNMLWKSLKILLNPLPKPLSNERCNRSNNRFPRSLPPIISCEPSATLDDWSGEQLVEGSAKLGRDIQTLFVDSSDLPQAEKFLSDNGLKDKVKAYTFEELDKAREMSSRVKPYFADIFSMQKALCCGSSLRRKV